MVGEGRGTFAAAAAAAAAAAGPLARVID